MFYDEIDKNTNEFKQLTVEEQRKLEVNLILFRNYVFLSLMALKAVAETYRGTDEDLFTLYQNQLERKSNFYEIYVDAAIKEVQKLNTGYGEEFFKKNFVLEDTDYWRYPAWPFDPAYVEFMRKCETVVSPRFPSSSKCNAEVYAMFSGLSPPPPPLKIWPISR